MAYAYVFQIYLQWISIIRYTYSMYTLYVETPKGPYHMQCINKTSISSKAVWADLVNG